MKKFLASVAMLLFAVPVFADDTAAPAAASMPAAVQAPMAKKAKGHMSTKDEAGIKKTFSKVSEAWAAADAHGVASYFTEDSSIINPMGIEGHGREGVQKVVEAEFAGPMKGTQ
ncbi:MAG TPA: SgcJ/EcaC family oxidoreductase, partial [bacterium]